MIIVDTALARRAEPIPVRVALVGGGYMARCIALQIVTAIRGMRLVAIANRTVSKAEAAYAEAGVTDTVRVDSVAALERAIAADRYAVTDDAQLLCRPATSTRSSRPPGTSSSARAWPSNRCATASTS